MMLSQPLQSVPTRTGGKQDEPEEPSEHEDACLFLDVPSLTPVDPDGLALAVVSLGTMSMSSQSMVEARPCRPSHAFLEPERYGRNMWTGADGQARAESRHTC
jgi:hypothetical protein